MEVTDGKQFAGYMRGVRRRTLDVIREVPPERASWRLSPDSMSVADIVLHIAAVEKALWGSGIRNGKAEPLVEFPRDSHSLEDALDYMAGVRQDSSRFWQGLTTEVLGQEVTTPTGDRMVLGRWLVLAAEHEIHHRSFVHAYRKIWGLESFPIYGLTLAELRRLLIEGP